MMTRLFQRILVGVDSTESSMAAGKLAVELASEHKADLTLVYVVNDDLARELSLALGQPEEQVRRDLESNGRRYLGEIGRLAAEAGVAAEQVVRRGSPPIELLAEASARGATLLVMGKTSAPPIRLRVRGRVLQRVLESAEVPVLVVRQP